MATGIGYAVGWPWSLMLVTSLYMQTIRPIPGTYSDSLSASAKYSQLSKSDALKRMLRHEPVDGFRCDETLTVPPDEFDGLVVFSNCQIREFRADFVHFSSPVKFENCTFDDMIFQAAYFYGGIVMRNCTVHGRLGFDCGGHNSNGEFELLDSQFGKLVDFEDCWFTGKVRIANVVFKSGTNLFGNIKTPVAVTFDVPPIVTDTVGKLDCDTYEFV